MDKEDAVHIYNGILLSYIKERNDNICSNKDGPRDYCTKWSKSDLGRQTSYDITYMWNLKKAYKWIYAEQKQMHRFWKQTYCYQRGQVGKGVDWGFGTVICTLWYIECLANGELLYSTGNSPLYSVMVYMQRNLKKNGCVCMYNWITLLYSRNYQNTVNQLYLKLKKKVSKHSKTETES